MTKLNNLDFGTRVSEMAGNIFSGSVGGKVFELLKPNNNLEFYNCPKNIFVGKILKVYKTSIKKETLKELFENYNGFNLLGQNALIIPEFEKLGLFIDKGYLYEISTEYSDFILKYLFDFNYTKFNLQILMLAYIKNLKSGTEGKLIKDIIILSSLYGEKIYEYDVLEKIEGFRLTGIISY